MEKALSKLDNLWYHHKWLIIISLFFIVVLIIGIVQMAGGEKTDIRIVYCGSAVLSGEQRDAIESAFEQVMSRDFDGDGKKRVRLNAFTILSDKQLEEKKREATEDGDVLYYDPNSKNDTLMQLNSLLGTGETIICLFEDHIYENLRDEDAFAKLENIVGYLPENAADEYSVRIGDTDLGQYFTAFENILPETRLCIRNMAVYAVVGNKKTAETEYGYHKEMFCDALNFTTP